MMVDFVFSLVTWGLLGIFTIYLAYGIAVAAFTLFRFYRDQFAKLAGNRAANLLK